MAVNVLRNRRRDRHHTTETPVHRRRWWRHTGTAPATDRPQPGRHLLARRTPVSNMIMGAALAATLILLLGILLTAIDADTGDLLVGYTLQTASWLATPFNGVFHDPDPQTYRYLTWGLTAVIYYAAGRTLSHLIRF
ncbi:MULTISPECIES: hypothetical protein [Thermomonospora]|uniref:Uncharacterized protein n=1 Tax=Thermomonospora cellulosilytica TaxID=1411118 RepID=A0A7W3RCG7_9ACTN|nr:MULTISPECIES: hypothetical protein [Thermomonospora]MBA9007829.1 hypothetical protein [Thermomonospora cellulosilytica]